MAKRLSQEEKFAQLQQAQENLQHLYEAAEENEEWALNELATRHFFGKNPKDRGHFVYSLWTPPRLSVPKAEWLKQDKRLAEKYTLQAAEMGDAQAQCNLGVLYFFGQDEAKERQAVEWFKISAAQGYANAISFLISYYDCLNLTDEETIFYLKKAVELDCVRALANLKCFLSRSESSPRITHLLQLLEKSGVAFHYSFPELIEKAFVQGPTSALVRLLSAYGEQVVKEGDAVDLAQNGLATFDEEKALVDFTEKAFSAAMQEYQYETAMWQAYRLDLSNAAIRVIWGRSACSQIIAQATPIGGLSETDWQSLQAQARALLARVDTLIKTE